MTNLVVYSATNIITMSGTAASPVSKPSNTSTPHKTSTPPTKLPKSSGSGRPILAKRPAPRVAGNRNFWIPSERNTPPTFAHTLRPLRLNRCQEQGEISTITTKGNISSGVDSAHGFIPNHNWFGKSAH